MLLPEQMQTWTFDGNRAMDETAGIALGFDRLSMLLMGHETLTEALP